MQRLPSYYITNQNSNNFHVFVTKQVNLCGFSSIADMVMRYVYKYENENVDKN